MIHTTQFKLLSILLSQSIIYNLQTSWSFTIIPRRTSLHRISKSRIHSYYFAQESQEEKDASYYFAQNVNDTIDNNNNNNNNNTTIIIDNIIIPPNLINKTALFNPNHIQRHISKSTILGTVLATFLPTYVSQGSIVSSAMIGLVSAYVAIHPGLLGIVLRYIGSFTINTPIILWDTTKTKAFDNTNINTNITFTFKHWCQILHDVMQYTQNIEHKSIKYALEDTYEK